MNLCKSLINSDWWTLVYNHKHSAHDDDGDELLNVYRSLPFSFRFQCQCCSSCAAGPFPEWACIWRRLSCTYRAGRAAHPWRRSPAPASLRRSRTSSARCRCASARWTGWWRLRNQSWSDSLLRWMSPDRFQLLNERKEWVEVIFALRILIVEFPLRN